MIGKFQLHIPYRFVPRIPLDMPADAARPRRRGDRIRLQFAAVLMSPYGRYCCKSPFALVIKNFPSCRRDFPVKMWGTSSPDDKFADDLGNAIEGRRISDRRSDFLQQENSRRAISDFCNNICLDRTHTPQQNLLIMFQRRLSCLGRIGSCTGLP